MKSTVVDESLSSYKPMYCSREYQASIKYTDTLCNTQKITSLESSLLQDIPTLNGQDSSQLEDWVTDIEMVSELTGESRIKLAQAKSRG